MKRIIIPAFALMLLSSCGAGNSNNNTASSNSDSTENEEVMSAENTSTEASGDIALQVATLLKDSNKLLVRDYEDYVWDRSCEYRDDPMTFSMYCEYFAERIEQVDISCHDMGDGKYYVIKHRRDCSPNEMYANEKEYYIYDGKTLEPTGQNPEYDQSGNVDSDEDNYGDEDYDPTMDNSTAEVREAVRLLGDKFLSGKYLEATEGAVEYSFNGVTPYRGFAEYRFECPKGEIKAYLLCLEMEDNSIMLMLGMNEKTDDGDFAKLEFYRFDVEGSSSITPMANPLEEKQDYRDMMKEIANSNGATLPRYYMTDSGIQIFLYDVETGEDIDGGCTYDWDFDNYEFIPGGWG